MGQQETAAHAQHREYHHGDENIAVALDSRIRVHKVAVQGENEQVGGISHNGENTGRAPDITMGA